MSDAIRSAEYEDQLEGEGIVRVGGEAFKRSKDNMTR